LIQKKILFIDTGSIIGGGQNNLILIVNNLNLQKFTPVVFSRSNSSLLSILTEAKIKTKELSLISKTSSSIGNFIIMIMNMFYLTYQLLKLVYYEKPEIIDSHCNDSHLPAIIVAKFFNISVVVHQNIYIKQIRHRIIDYLCGIFSDRIISISKATQKKLTLPSSAINKLNVVYPSIHPNIFNSDLSNRFSLRNTYKIKDDQIVIGTLARISPEKGLEYLIKAIQKIKDAHFNIKLIIAGDVSSEAEKQYEQKLFDIINEQKMENDVIFHRKTLNNVIEGSYDFNDFDISVAPSIDEAFGMFILESMALKIAVVASNVGGIPEVVVPDETAILVNPRDSNALAKAILILIIDKKKRIKMGENGRKRAAKYFSINRTMLKIERIFNEI